MNYFLKIDEDSQVVDFNSSTLVGAKEGLAELKRRKKHYALRKREAHASRRQNRSTYFGRREISIMHGGRNNWISSVINFFRFQAHTNVALDDAEIVKVDRILIAIDKTILQIEDIIRDK